MNSSDNNFKALLDLALTEDLGSEGDVTSRAIFGDEQSTAYLYSKDTGVLAGLPYFEKVMRKVDPQISIRILIEEGSSLKPGDKIAEITGPTVTILEAERTGINFLSFLSGIATEASKAVAAARSTGNAVILDTRKTLPGYRTLSKYAVTVGGAENHRMGLYDLVMIKDNHADAAGSLEKAVQKVRDKWGDRFRIETECRNIDEVKQALALKVDIIMLDNMTAEECIEAVKLRSNGVLFEASGNMNLERIKEYSPTGVDYISVGKLTHSVAGFDFSLRMQ